MATEALGLALGLIVVNAGAQPSTTPTHADWTKPLAERQPLIAGASGDGYPYSFFNDRGEPDGFAAEVLNAVARTMNLPIDRVSYPALELNARFREGEFDLLQLYSQTPEREAYTEFSVPLLTLQGAVFVRRNGPISRLENLNDQNFAIVGVGSIGERFLREHGLHPHVRQVASPAEALRLVDSGECAGTFLTQLTAQANIRKSGLRNVEMLGDPIDGYDVRHCFAVHRGDAQLLARLNEGLAILHETGEFDRLRQTWFGTVTGRLFTREQVVTYVAGALALGCAAALWGVWRQRGLRRRIAQLNAGLEARIAERTAELGARIGEVERLNAAQAALVRDLRASQRIADQAAASLEEANTRLIAANQELEAFSYSASHDLRAPLRNITGFLELLRQRLKDGIDDEGARFLTIMTSETKRMGLLIDDLLTFSRVGRTEMKLVPFELTTVVANVRDELQAEAAGRTIEWRVGALPTVNGDLVLVRQIIINLLDNALKFTRQRETAVIEVGAMTADDGDRVATIFVRDNGAGYDPQYADKLFGVFQRLHSQRDFEGTGIGLANVKRIVVRHGGRVWSEGAVNGGATFYFTLPVSDKA